MFSFWKEKGLFFKSKLWVFVLYILMKLWAMISLLTHSYQWNVQTDGG